MFLLHQRIANPGGKDNPPSSLTGTQRQQIISRPMLKIDASPSSLTFTRDHVAQIDKSGNRRPRVGYRPHARSVRQDVRQRILNSR